MRHRPSCRSRAMHVPRELYPIERALAEHLPHLRGPQRRGLALWVLGAVLAQSACQAAVLAALLPWAPYHALRQRLREWLLDGADKACPCAAQVEADACFAPLLRWVLDWWQGRELALAVDATAHREDVVALVVSVLYRGSAIPVAWAILPGNTPGPWLGPILRLLRLLRPAVPPGWTVLVPADRGLWSPRLWRRIRRLGWHPLLRVQRRTTPAPHRRGRCPAGGLVRPREARGGPGRVRWAEGPGPAGPPGAGRAPAHAGSAWFGSASGGCATCSRGGGSGVASGSPPSPGRSRRPGSRSPSTARKHEPCRIPTPVSVGPGGERDPFCLLRTDYQEP